MNADPYLRKVATLAKRLSREFNVDVDDLFQEGVVGLLQALQRHDPIRGRFWDDFAYFRVSGAMRDYIRDLTGSRSETIVEVESLDDDNHGEIPSQEPTPQEHLEQYDTIESLARLPYRERVVVIRHGLGDTYDEISVDLGVSRDTVRRLLYRGSTKIQVLRAAAA